MANTFNNEVSKLDYIVQDILINLYKSLMRLYGRFCIEIVFESSIDSSFQFYIQGSDIHHSHYFSAMTSVPTILLTTPEQDLYDLTAMFSLLSAGETLPLRRRKGELLPAYRARITDPLLWIRSSAVLPDGFDNHPSTSGNVMNASRVVKRTKGDARLRENFHASQVDEGQLVSQPRLELADSVISVMVNALNVSGIVRTVSRPSVSSSLTFVAQSSGGQTGLQSLKTRQVSYADLDSLAHRDHQPHSHTLNVCNNIKRWELAYTPSKLTQHQLASIITLQPVPTHKKKGILSAMTLLKVNNELIRAGIQPRRFSLSIPKHYEQIEVQFRLLGIRNGWDKWPASDWRDAQTWPLTKKWLLIHQFEALAWLRKQCYLPEKKVDLPRSLRIGVPPLVKTVVPCSLRTGVPPPVKKSKRIDSPVRKAREVSTGPVRTAYFYMLRDQHHKVERRVD